MNLTNTGSSIVELYGRPIAPGEVLAVHPHDPVRALLYRDSAAGKRGVRQTRREPSGWLRPKALPSIEGKQGGELEYAKAMHAGEQAPEPAEAGPPPAVDAPPAPAPVEAGPTREELEARCRELGVMFDGRYSDKRLLSDIAKAEAPAAAE